MQQYNVDFFDRNLDFVYNATVNITSIDDDYISGSVNSVEIPSTFLVNAGHFIRLSGETYNFFGVVTEAAPGDNRTIIHFKSFLTIFDEEILFNTSWQGTSENSNRPTLESALLQHINALFVNTTDTYQRLPISVSIDPTLTQTSSWNLGLLPDTENGHFTITNLYSNLIVGALKEYGVSIDVTPSFHDSLIYLKITKHSTPFKISADLDNVVVKTLKYNSKTIGTNKLIVYNADNYTDYIIFYVYTDQSWGVEDRDRITPVIREIKTATPDSEISDSEQAFVSAATDVAYGALSGTAYDNLIELNVYADDQNISPLALNVGQVATIWYRGATYTSILTGRIIDGNKVTLLFGSQRIEYSKRFKLNGGK